MDGSPSSWFVVASGGTRTYRFDVSDPAALGVAAQVYMRDHVTELTADLSARMHAEKAAEQLEFDFRHPLPRQSGNGLPS
jgi:hypothetical protein